MMIRADARHIPLADNSVDCVVTSPPYLKQRAYGTDDTREVGRDETLAAYVQDLADVFDELRRVMKPTATAWLNIGSKSNNSGGAGGDWNQQGGDGRTNARRTEGGPGRFLDPAFEEQTDVDVPGAVLAELLRRRWRQRTIIWDKGREAPEALRHVRRPRVAHEMIYMLFPFPRPRHVSDARPRFYPSMLAETGSVWHFKPGGDGDPHLAPFPDELARRCILPTTLPGDVVFDPFSGSHTVERVARSLGRVGIGTDIYAGRPDLVHGMAAT